MLMNCHQLSHVSMPVLGARENYIPCIFSFLVRTWPHVVIYVTIKSTKEDESNVSKKKRKRGACTWERLGLETRLCLDAKTCGGQTRAGTTLVRSQWLILSPNEERTPLWWRNNKNHIKMIFSKISNCKSSKILTKKDTPNKNLPSCKLKLYGLEDWMDGGWF